MNAPHFNFKQLPKYPGMRPRDVVIWDEFILKNPNAFLSVYYDVHIGDPCDDQTKHDEMRANGMYNVSQWCVDVVAQDGKVYYVIEIKPEARAAAIGQALSYTALLQKEKILPKETIPMVLTDNIHPITLQAAQLLGVTLMTP